MVICGTGCTNEGGAAAGVGGPGAVVTVQYVSRTEYDHIMLQLHNCMKVDDRYQKEVQQIEFEFPAGSTWLALTDQVSHAAMRGQYQLKQTFLVAVENLRNEPASPLRVLERLNGR